MVRASVKQLLQSNPDQILIMDGGQGTELENRGINVANPVWSTIPFINDSFWSDRSSRDRQIVAGMFEEYIAAGANLLMTITYQSSFKSVSENTDIKTLEEYNQLLDRIVAFSRTCIGADNYLVGCIGSWGAHICAEFSGDYGEHPERIPYLDYFRPQLNNFNLQEDIDVIGFETIPNIHELTAILSWDESIIKKPFYIGMSVHEHGTLRDGTTMSQVAQLFRSLGKKLNPNFLALGINCCSFRYSHMILESLHEELPYIPLIAYPNSGELYDTVKKIWLKNENCIVTWDEIVKSYLQSGARIIGGCCRTTPNDIRQIVTAVKKYKP
ncbi:S-adenosylmethionine-homocysteine S-methyltransferase SAM4 Ecym_4612 [Eremothecium cymbalariae DBVPG|uniref:homocysteine S-methyltransferase n=1 Tax=Eremothecium cymbalariae (strain CBS 270.75 / DBVPG 7215 / KCTC 17166 / NRRL Y-17582) TaxID=931890 RepID=G8JSB9_ERECY|nr:hypothetical protein Ecym_4612 [Eremothecium cymbalariae DBVPG\